MRSAGVSGGSSIVVSLNSMLVLGRVDLLALVLSSFAYNLNELWWIFLIFRQDAMMLRCLLKAYSLDFSFAQANSSVNASCFDDIMRLTSLQS